MGKSGLRMPSFHFLEAFSRPWQSSSSQDKKPSCGSEAKKSSDESDDGGARLGGCIIGDATICLTLSRLLGNTRSAGGKDETLCTDGGGTDGGFPSQMRMRADSNAFHACIPHTLHMRFTRSARSAHAFHVCLYTCTLTLPYIDMMSYMAPVIPTTKLPNTALSSHMLVKNLSHYNDNELYLFS